MSELGHSRRFWDVCAKSVLHSTSDIMARMQDQVSVGFTGARPDVLTDEHIRRNDLPRRD
jgi:hypothetical protein